MTGGRLEAAREEDKEELLSCTGTDASQVRALCGLRREQALRSVVSATVVSVTLRIDYCLLACLSSETMQQHLCC